MQDIGSQPPKQGVPSQGNVWASALPLIKKELSEQSFKTWIQQARYKSLTEDHLILLVPDKFYGDWLKDRYHEIIRQAVSQITGKELRVSYEVGESRQMGFSSKPTPSRPEPGKKPTHSLNERYNFDDFVIGPGNRFAHAAAIAVSEAPAKNYNPLFIYGRVGLGKTHLMQAAAHAILDRNPDAKVLYMSGEKFTTQLISAIQNRSTSALRTKLRGSDILLVDDVHFIAGKESTQEEFFHTFNTLYDAHKQIIVSSDRPPKEIPGLEERLVSRFAWGLVTDIQPPDFETRVAILKKKMEREQINLDDDVVYFIANKIKSNIRELEGALIRVVAYAQLTGSPVDVGVVEGQILKDALMEELGNITIDKVQKAVCDYFQLKLSDLRAKNRSKSIAYPRQIAMALVREMTDHSLPEIGAYFGGRGHATVIHACNKIERMRSKGGKIHETIDDIKLLIKKA